MGKLFLLIIVVFILYAEWPSDANQPENMSDTSDLQNLKAEFLELKNNPSLNALFNSIISKLNNLFEPLTDTQSQVKEEITQVDAPELVVPENHFFSVYNIELGDSREVVEQQIGRPKRSSFNEYGIKWHAYHSEFQNFFMVAYDEENKVAGLYTNQDLITSESGIQFGTSKYDILEQMGPPLSNIRKGFVYYQFEDKQDYGTYHIDDSYVTLFYDKHKNNILSGIQIINESLENKKQSFYGEPSEQLMKGFEYQLYDLTNAERVNYGLDTLSWDDHVRLTARDHSSDMAEHHYFSHTNLEGETPFTRMSEDDINYVMAGENLAYGQFSSIFAHEGLMNSLGHRKNILQPKYEFLGVGVAFNDDGQPYFTENFYAN